MKHLNIEDRRLIENALKVWNEEGYTFQIIADSLDKDPTTISKEIKLHRTMYTPKKFNNYNQCAKKYDCTLRNVCRTDCRYSCKDCGHCNKFCKEYEEQVCPILKKPPYVCNGCSEATKCRFKRYFYYAQNAQEQYEYTQKDSKTGINMNYSQFKVYEETLVNGLKNNQSFEHIIHSNPDKIPYSVRSVYRHLDKNYFNNVKNIDLHNKVKFRCSGKKKTVDEMRKLKKEKEGRRYVDFLAYIEKHPGITVVEMDTVIGKIDEGACMLTFMIRNSHITFAFKLENHNSQAVVDKINEMYEAIGAKAFKNAFPVILTDNGSEFDNIHDIEYAPDGTKRCKLFFCDSHASGQKGMLENVHRLYRYVIPKKSSFVGITQEDITKVYNNINSYKRTVLNHNAPIDIGKFLIPIELYNYLKLEELEPNQVLLKPSLIN